MLISKH